MSYVIYTISWKKRLRDWFLWTALYVAHILKSVAYYCVQQYTYHTFMVYMATQQYLSIF